MAVTFGSTINFDNLFALFDTGSDHPTIYNGEGVEVSTSTAFDYFSNSPSVNQTFELRRNRIYKDIIFYVGTPMDGTPTFVWEYKLPDESWSALTVANGDALTKSGSQTVSFTPPDGWTGVAADRPLHRIRCRLTGVTGVTEGGAQSTNKIQTNSYGFIVTGTDQTLTNVMTAENASGYTVLPAITSTTNLVPLEFPHKKLGSSARIKVTLAGATLGVGDTVAITGTDKNGNALSESIDVSGGNATYTSVNQYQSVTDLDCNGFSDGTIAVDTETLGMVVKNGNQFFFGCHLFIGDDSTATSFSMSKQQILFDTNYSFCNFGSSMFTMGAVETSGKLTTTYNGCAILLDFQKFYEGSHHLNKANGTWNIYGSLIYADVVGWLGGTLFGISGTVVARDSSLFMGDANCAIPAATTLNNVQFEGLAAGYGFFATGSSLTGLKMNSVLEMLNNRTNQIAVTGGLFETWNRVNNFDAGRKIELIDCNMATTDFTNMTVENFEAADGLYLEYTSGFVVKDGSGNPLSGVTIAIYNLATTNVFFNTTDVNGTIAAQKLVNNKFTWTYPGSGGSWAAHTPHTVKILDYTKVYNVYSKNVTVDSTDTQYLSADNFVVSTEVQANALTGMAITWASSLVTVTSARSIQNLYDYCKAQNKASAGNAVYSQPITTIDGITFSPAFNITVNAVELSGTGKTISLGTKTLLLSSGGTVVPTIQGGTLQIDTAGSYSLSLGTTTLDFTGAGTYNLGGSTITGTITLDTSNNSTVTVQLDAGVSYVNTDVAHITVEVAPLTVTLTVGNVIAGSRIQVYATGSSTELYNEIVSGTSWTKNVTYTADIPVRIRLMYVNGATTAYKWWTTTSTITTAGFSVNAAQEANSVYTTNNIDGSTVTECSISGTTVRIYVDDPDNTTTAQRIYNWFQYYLFTEAGIREQDGTYVVATDSTHYTFANTMKIINQDTVNPLNITGANIVPVSGAATNIFDLTNGASIALNFNRVEGFAYSSGSGLSTEEHNALLGTKTTVDTNLDAPVSRTLKTTTFVGFR